MSLVLFFLWRNGEARPAIGWTVHKPGREAMLGILLFPIMFFGAALLDGALLKIGFTTPKTPLPSQLEFHGTPGLLLAFLLVVVVAISEETIFRGYLILRLKAATNSLSAALLLSSLIFSIGHGYEGSAGVVTVGTMGMAFALVYLWRGSLVAPMVMHFLQDFLAIVLLPVISKHSGQ